MVAERRHDLSTVGGPEHRPTGAVPPVDQPQAKRPGQLVDNEMVTLVLPERVSSDETPELDPVIRDQQLRDGRLQEPEPDASAKPLDL